MRIVMSLEVSFIRHLFELFWHFCFAPLKGMLYRLRIYVSALREEQKDVLLIREPAAKRNDKKASVMCRLLI